MFLKLPSLSGMLLNPQHKKATIIKKTIATTVKKSFKYSQDFIAVITRN